MNTELLNNRINCSGLSKSYIAESLGITRQGLSKKLNGESEFKGSEIKKLSNLLGMSIEEKEFIFFADYVDENAN